MNDQTPADPYGPRRHIYHGIVTAHGKDVYPPELYEAAMKNMTPAGYGDEAEDPAPPHRRVITHPPVVADGKDVYPPEMFEKALKNMMIAGSDVEPPAEPPRAG